MKDLIEERTGAKPGTIGGFFSLNPKVDDLPDRLSIKIDNIRLMVMGGIKKGGSGCICPESALLKQLIRHIVISRDEAVVMDMEAGLEHLARGTAMFVDKLIVVVEPGRRSIETALQIKKLASDLGIKNIAVVGNKIRSQQDEVFIKENLKNFEFLCFLPFKEEIIESDLKGIAVFENDKETLENIKSMIQEKIL
jgi:CO dehydrogenase maturation factor